MTEAERRALEREREKIAKMFPDAPVVSSEMWQREKEEARVRDWERIARGEATPEQIQRENSPFTPEQVKDFRIVNLEEVLAKMR